MASKRGPESFIKRQRERAKQQEQIKKDQRRRERSALKKEAKLNGTTSPLGNIEDAPLGPVNLVKKPGTSPLGNQ